MAASATLRMVKARRSSITAISTTHGGYGGAGQRQIEGRRTKRGGQARAARVAQCMRLDEARDTHITEFLRQHRRTHGLSAELADNEAASEGKQGPADTKTKWHVSDENRDAESSGEKGGGRPQTRLIAKGEIGDDAAGEQHRKLEKPPVGFGLQRP